MSPTNDIRPDTKQPLLDVHDGSTSTLIAHLLEIQNHAQSREETKKQASRLRFLDVSSTSHVSASQRQEMTSLPIRILDLTRREDITGHSYIAVSWRWKSADEGKRPDSSFQYRIRTPGGILRSSDFPDSYFDRVINFARAEGIQYIWIDKDCIKQHNTVEKSKDVQAMDRIYRNSKFAVGLVHERIHTEKELESLTDLISGSCFPKSSKNIPGFKQDIPEQRISNIYHVLRKILEDERWERAWIFQEDRCASGRMHYLIPCNPSLPKDGRYQYGSIPGELRVPSADFRQAATRFLLSLGIIKYPYPREMLHKVMQYNIWDRTVSSETSTTFANTTVSILSNLELKYCEYQIDRIAILANCCDYPIGLNIEPLKSGKFSLSTAIMALYLLNGEIFGNTPHHVAATGVESAKALLANPVLEYLRASSLRLEIPGPAFNHSFMANCRFPRVKLTNSGIKTSGWVFVLRGTLKFSRKDEKWIARKAKQLEETEPGTKELRHTQKSVLWLLVHKLNGRGFNKLASFLVEYMRRDRQGLKTATTRFINRMIEAVLGASKEQKRPLLLGYLGGQSQPSGLFVCSALCSQNDRPRMAFTSWSKNGSQRLKNFVSVQVESESSGTEARRLSCISWINGVWDVGGHPKSACIFKWPFEV
ncbi:heterokaryon incompatibility protein-domain-containing protein [Macrophomina phaseolina]|uniref:Heterokaryon incompatibility protein-domain-containing protein n=1 Tax=Macrophomina phaseolina TaxID=35725 RepID=A0ABQ8G1R3_9PEZI|nr:heterokaryon incompatibility protein-domain-containing protein [Macrophomina phaseolina]